MDWPVVMAFLASLAGAFAFRGVARGAFTVLSVLTGAMNLYKVYEWNGRPWRRIHFRAMLLYTRYLAYEEARRRQSGVPFDMTQPCRDLAFAICGRGKSLYVDAMLASLQEERAGYFVSILQRHRHDLLPTLDDATFSRMLDSLRRGVDFDPCLVVGNIIENTFGGLEAARYVLALLSGDAY